MKHFLQQTVFSRRLLPRLLVAILVLIAVLGLIYNRAYAANYRPAPPFIPGLDTLTTATATDTTTPIPSLTPSTTVTATTVASATSTTTPTPGGLPRFDHIVVVVEENKDYSEIIGANTTATYINSLLTEGTLFTNYHAVTHPSQPNYLDLYSGSDQGVNGDACSASTFPQPDLGGQLIGAGFSFAGYSESMPSAGYTGCYDTPTTFGSLYARKHNPWANFSDANGTSTNLTFSSFPTASTDFSKLPTVSFVIPNLQNDMHDGSIQQGDSWLKQNMSSYIEWARTHNSLCVVIWDEENESNGVESNPNQVPLIFVGQHVQAGSTSNANLSHYDMLRTLEDMYGLPPANNAATASDITGVWN